MTDVAAEAPAEPVPVPPEVAKVEASDNVGNSSFRTDHPGCSLQ
jgi:hypothetical protein